MSVESQNARKDDNIGAEMDDPDEMERGLPSEEGYVFLKEDFSSVSSTSDLHSNHLSQVCIMHMNRWYKQLKNNWQKITASIIQFQSKVVTVSSAPSLNVTTYSNARKNEILQQQFKQKSRKTSATKLPEKGD